MCKNTIFEIKILTQMIIFMKKTVAAMFITAFLMTVSCTNQGTPAKQESLSDGAKIAQGKTIFENSCGRCHDLPEPKDYTDQQWIPIVNSMAPKAKLTTAQGEMVYLYITSKN